MQGRFEAANGGTLFLDEIGNLSMVGQAKLLRVLQTGEFERLGSSQTRRVKVRIISATNSDLPSSHPAGRFREDLYYRLNVIELQVPPLADRATTSCRSRTISSSPAELSAPDAARAAASRLAGQRARAGELDPARMPARDQRGDFARQISAW